MAKLREQSINVDLLPMNQQAPASMGPTGRVDRVVNGVVRKFLGGGSGNRLSIEQRPGSTSLNATTFSNGSLALSPSDPRLLASWKDQLLLIGGTTPYVRSEARDRWEALSSVYLTAPSVALQTITKRPLYNASNIAYAPDAASVGDVLCDIVMDSVLGARVTLVDADGVQIRAPFAPAGTARAKVVSDGTHFWVFSQASALTSTSIQVIDTDGHTLASASIAWGAARDKWDAGFQSTTGATYLATPTGATLTVSYSTYAAGVITTTSFAPAIDASLGVARIENTRGGTRIYVACVNAASDVTPYEITSAGAISNTYGVVAATAVGVNNITGFVSNSSFDLKLAISVPANNTAVPSTAALNNFILVGTATYAGGTGTVTQRSLAVVSRAFVDDIGTWRVVAYYQSTACSNTAAPPSDVSQLGAQPTFFVVDISGAVPAVVGQFDTGFAYAFYASSRNSQQFYPWHLSSVAADASGVQHIPLGYLGAETALAGGGFTLATFSALTGIEDVRISARVGKPVITGDALMIPGLQADFFDGTVVAEWGLHLAPEIVSVTFSAGGGLNPAEIYTWVAVEEWTDAQGNLHQSSLSAPWQQVVVSGGSNGTATITIACDRVTAKTNVSFAIYQTYSPTLTGNTPGVLLRFVGRVANNLLANTVTFTAATTDAQTASGAECYSQPLDTSAPVALDFQPPPAFSAGAVADGRVFVIGYDRAIWFSFQKIEGQGIAFNSVYRMVLPTAANPVAIVAMDTRIIVLGDDGTTWTADMGNLPNATLSSGAIPTLQQLPATTGATAAAALIPAGAIYGALSGVWLMDRGLTSRFIGGPVLDEVDALTQIQDIAVDSAQRVFFTLAAGGIPGNESLVLVFDLIAGCWYVWDMPAVVYASTTWRGQFAFADAAGVVHVMDDPASSTYADDGAEIPYSIAISSMAFGGPSGWQRLWGETIFGQWKGPHRLRVAFTYDNEVAASETFTMPVGVDPGTYRFEVRQEKQKDIAVAMTLSSNYDWPTLATILSATATRMVLDDVTTLAVGTRYSTQAAAVLDAGAFEVASIDLATRTVGYVASGGWVPTVGNLIVNETSSLSPGNSFTVESVQLRIGTKPGLGRLPTQRRIAP